MIIYNVTINVQEDIHDEWLKWMKEEHIPDMLDTKKFSKALMTKVMVQEPMGGITYSVQYTTESREMLQRYYDENAEDLRSRSKAFEGKFVAFRTELEVITEQ
ncbi:DUF4286 family protein [Gramella jeungdoensis]|uniref:DUF4286 family protein n=1 Tax=Gramella jeungdoensis TaxID=708091 RepID=A0ABT0Z8B5_9FLAO|nr:DUF4286 family protein [Gramella jeungdoensis]MCM8570989.1 DUF4286 family protein [Gramella jeungdoensis]